MGLDTSFMEATERLPDEHKRQAEELRLANEECDRLKKELSAANARADMYKRTNAAVSVKLCELEREIEALKEDEPTLREHARLKRENDALIATESRLVKIVEIVGRYANELEEALR